jgi:hypothetical protein
MTTMESELSQNNESQQEKDILERHSQRELEHGGGIITDVFNTWMSAFGCTAGDIERLQPIPTYEERLQTSQVTSPVADFIIEHSDPEKVQRYNELVRKFNDDLGRIKAEKDYKTAGSLARQAFAIIGRNFD